MARKLFSENGNGHLSGGQALSGKTFFLDVRGQTTAIATDLGRFGAKIEKFLNTNVDYVITNRSQSTPRKEKQSKQTRGAENSRRKAMVTRSNQTQKADVRSYAVGFATKWGIQVLTLAEIKDWISQQKSTGKTKTLASSHQLKQGYIKVEDRKRRRQPVVKETRSLPKLDHTPSTYLNVPSPPRTRSGGRRATPKATLRRPSSSPAGGSAGNTTKRTRRSAGTVSEETTPRRTPRSRKPLTSLVARQPNVHFQIARVPPASELIPKPKALKKTNVTMRRAKRELDFGDAPPPARKGKSKAMSATKKIIILQELQDRLDGISQDPSPVKQATRRQPGRGKKASPSPKKVTVARLARQLKKELHESSQEITPMALRNGKVKLTAH